MTTNAVPRETILLIQAIGSRKPPLSQTIATINGSIMFIIENTLALFLD